MSINIYDYYITPDEYDEAAANGVSGPLLEVRIRTLSWKKRKAIETPPHKKQPLKDWVEVAAANGICYSTLRYRANRLGWDLERAATQPLQDRSAQARAAHESSRKYPKKYKDLAAYNGIPDRTFHKRLELGWSLEDAANKPIMTRRECGLKSKATRSKYIKSMFINVHKMPWYDNGIKS